MNKTLFMVVTCEDNGKLWSYAIKVPGSYNLVSVLAGIGGIKTANICQTYKRAQEIADCWNQTYKANGKNAF